MVKHIDNCIVVALQFVSNNQCATVDTKTFLMACFDKDTSKRATCEQCKYRRKRGGGKEGEREGEREGDSDEKKE